MIWIYGYHQASRVLDIKIIFEEIIDNSNTLFRIIAYNPQNGKVRPITPYINYYQLRKWFQVMLELINLR